MGSTATSGISGAMKKFTAMKNIVTWFEIPAYDMDRAKAFYDHVYGISMEVSRNAEFAMAFFPHRDGVGGAVVQGPGCLPNDTGTLIYLNAGHDLDTLLARVVEAGGRVVMGRTPISADSGWFALFIDSEGNRLALHERPQAKTKRTPVSAARAPRKAASAKPAKRAVRKHRQ